MRPDVEHCIDQLLEGRGAPTGWLPQLSALGPARGALVRTVTRLLDDATTINHVLGDMIDEGLPEVTQRQWLLPKSRTDDPACQQQLTVQVDATTAYYAGSASALKAFGPKIGEALRGLCADLRGKHVQVDRDGLYGEFTWAEETVRLPMTYRRMRLQVVDARIASWVLPVDIAGAVQQALDDLPAGQVHALLRSAVGVTCDSTRVDTGQAVEDALDHYVQTCRDRRVHEQLLADVEDDDHRRAVRALLDDGWVGSWRQLLDAAGVLVAT